MTSFSNVFISSSLIKEVCRLGGNVNEMAPPVSVRSMRRRFAEQRDREARTSLSDPPENTDPTVIDLVDQLEELVSTGRRVPFHRRRGSERGRGCWSSSTAPGSGFPTS